MTWTWSYQPAGSSIDPAERFGSQSDAESWLGEHWRGIAEQGITSALLVNDDEAVGRPIQLSE